MINPNLKIMRELISFTKDRAKEYKTFTGAFIVKDGKVISREITSIETDQDPLAHAEIKAIRSATKKLGISLKGCQLYTTQKPCVMCAPAIVWIEIDTVFHGISTNHHWLKNGDLEEFLKRFNICCLGPVLEEECNQILAPL